MDSLWRILYALVMLISLCAAWFLLQRKQRSFALSSREKAILGLSAFIGAMLGAKIPFIGELGWQGVLSGTIWIADGKTILGGVFGGYLAVEIVKAWMGIRVGTGDAFAIPIAVAVMIGRVGCFFAGCCFGTVTSLPWGVAFPHAHDPPGILRHPAQIYEVFFHLSAIGVLTIAEKQAWYPGQRLKGYLLSYLVFRFFSEWIRPEARVWLGLTYYQVACVGLSLILIGLWIRDDRRYALSMSRRNA